jgi:fatty acid amide hydrolase
MIDFVNAHPSGTFPPVPFREPDAVDVSRLRVALLPEIGDWTPSPAISRALSVAVDKLRERGATVEVWTGAPDTQAGVELFFNIVGADSFSFVQQLLEGEKPVPLLKPNAQLTSMPSALVPILARVLRSRGERRLSNMALNTRSQSAAGLMNILGDRLRYEMTFTQALDTNRYDAILCPALPVVAPPHGKTNEMADFWGSLLLFNVLGMPAGVAPITMVRDGETGSYDTDADKAVQTAHETERGSVGLPVAVQIAARHWREDIVLALMKALEQACYNEAGFPVTPTG